jgi:putative oxidoreductase
MFKKFLSHQALSTDLASLLLRLLVGGLFAFHYGYLKVEAYHQYVNVFPGYLGLSGPTSYNLVIFAEVFCGFLVLIGLFTRLAIIPITVVAVVAHFVAHAKDSFDNPNKQILLIHLVLTIVIFVLGSGRFSIDWLLQKKKPRV